MATLADSIMSPSTLNHLSVSKSFSQNSHDLSVQEMLAEVSWLSFYDPSQPHLSSSKLPNPPLLLTPSRPILRMM